MHTLLQVLLRKELLVAAWQLVGEWVIMEDKPRPGASDWRWRLNAEKSFSLLVAMVLAADTEDLSLPQYPWNYQSSPSHSEHHHSTHPSQALCPPPPLTSKYVESRRSRRLVVCLTGGRWGCWAVKGQRCCQVQTEMMKSWSWSWYTTGMTQSCWVRQAPQHAAPNNTTTPVNGQTDRQIDRQTCRHMPCSLRYGSVYSQHLHCC